MDLAFLEETKFCLPARRSCRNPSPAFPSPCPTLPALFGTWWRNPSPLRGEGMRLLLCRSPRRPRPVQYQCRHPFFADNRRILH